jgi:hypothetical protein
MAITDQQRHQMIERAVRPLPQACADVSVVLWERLAAELTVVIGDRGFSSLYSRSLNEAGAEFAWLAPHPTKGAADAFKLLASTLATRTPAEAQAANAAVLNIFIDTLIILIGELVTNSILLAAWGDDVVNDAGTEHGT